LGAAALAFAEQGFAATSMDDVAAAAGITKLIVYRHFESKEALYDAVLERVSERLTEEILEGVKDGRTGSVGVRALLTVAREDPAGFNLLWRHAAREAQFAGHADAVRQRGVRLADTLLTAMGVADGRVRRWAAATIVSYLVAAVLHWMEEGTPARDAEFAAMVGRSLPALIGAWTGIEPAAAERDSRG
jgi:AcrR family transcriptional regulator